MHIYLIALFARWCAPCHIEEPVLDQFQKDHPQVELHRYDVDQFSGAQIGQRYGIRQIPSLLFIDSDSGRLLRVLIGVNTEADIQDSLDQLSPAGPQQ